MAVGIAEVAGVDPPRALVGPPRESRAGLFGLGVGVMSTLLTLAWADYFGRESFGAIRSVALSLQVLAQAVGPLLSGALRDWSGNYTISLVTFGILAALAAVVALAARRPRAVA